MDAQSNMDTYIQESTSKDNLMATSVMTSSPIIILSSLEQTTILKLNMAASETITIGDIVPSGTSLSEISDVMTIFPDSNFLYTSSSMVITETDYSTSSEPTQSQYVMHDEPIQDSNQDYISVTPSLSSVISLSETKQMDISSIKSATPRLSQHLSSSTAFSQSDNVLTSFLSSASPTKSDMRPTATIYSGSSSKVTQMPPNIGSSPTTPSAITTSSVTETSSQDTGGFKINSTALYIAIPVCFLIIFIAVCMSVTGYNKRKKKRKWNSTNERGNLWLNPVSDIPLPANSVSTVTTDLLSEVKTSNKLNTVPQITNNENKGGINIYRVVYQFEAQLESQISLQPDEIVSVVERAENGWFRGEVLGRSGWFPSSYVEEIQPPSVENLEKVENDGSLKKKSHVTSFLLKKRDKHRKRSRNKDIEETEAFESEKDSGVVAEVIHMNDISSNLMIDDITISSPGKLFKAVFAYKASCKGEIGLDVSDIVTCLERDRNGWMKGYNLRSREEGWFPAVYVNEASEEDIPQMPTPQPVTYDQLIPNKIRTSNQDAIGIEHKALYSYKASKADDLNFEEGDTIVIFETLDNGWWLGCKGEDVGWLPGSYVELIDKSDDSSSNASSSVKNFSIFDEIEQGSIKSNRSSFHSPANQSDTIYRDPSKEKSRQIKKRESQTVLSADFKPVRKAPPPPPSAKATPIKSALTNPNRKSMDSLASDQVVFRSNGKPELPVRTVKTKVVKVSKMSTKKLRNLSIQPQPIERPLPPRPRAPPPKPPTQSKYKKYKPKDKISQPNQSVNQNGGIDSSFKKVPPTPPIRDLDDIGIELRNDELNESINSNESSLTNSVGPKILNRISAHFLLDEVSDNSLTPRMGKKVKGLLKVAPPVLPAPPSSDDNKENILDNPENSENYLTEIVMDNNESVKNVLDVNQSHNPDINVIKDNASTNNNLEESLQPKNSFKNQLEGQLKDQIKQVQKPILNSKPTSPKPTSSKPPPPKTPPPSKSVHIENEDHNIDIPSTTKRTNLRIAVRSFQALEEGELSFEEGHFIMDIDEECSRPGWCVGMLADGTTGIYPRTHVGSSRSQLQTEL